MATTTPSLADLARDISTNVEILAAHFKNANIPEPTFAPDTHLHFPAGPDNVEVMAARRATMEAAKKLYDLLLGPFTRLHRASTGCLDTATLQAISRFNLTSHVPLTGSTTYTALATATSLPEHRVRRLLQYAMTMGLFREPTPGTVAHTDLSAHLSREAWMQDVVSFITEDMFPASSRLVDAAELFGASGEPNHAGFNLAYQTPRPYFEYIAGVPARSARFSSVMNGMAMSPGLANRFLFDGFDWQGVGEGTVVDVGGSRGHTSIALAERFPSLSFIVEDTALFTAEGTATLPSSLSSRITFQTHDMFTPQPVAGAAVYLLRWILHDWSDDYCAKILAALVPALRKGSRVLIADIVKPEVGVLGALEERELRTTDLFMMALHNSQERSLEDFERLFKRVDARFSVVAHRQPVGSALGFVEARLETEEV